MLQPRGRPITFHPPASSQVTSYHRPAAPLIKDSLFLLLLFLKEEKSSDRHQATMGLYLPNDRNAHKTFPSFAPSSPLLLSFITQLSFVGLIRLYLVWVHWGEKHVKGKGRGSGSKVTWFVRLQKYREKVSDTSATTLASVWRSTSCMTAVLLMFLWKYIAGDLF